MNTTSPSNESNRAPSIRVPVDGPAQAAVYGVIDNCPDVLDYGQAEQVSLQQEVAALQAGAHAVRSVISFDVDAPTPWQVPTDKAGTCLNYAWAMSGVVETLGMTSRIGYCNGHVMNVVVGKTGALHVINADDLPHAWYFDAVNEGAETMFNQKHVEAIAQVTDNHAALVPLNTRKLESKTILEHSTSGDRRITPKPWMAADHAGLTVMTPWYAKQALQNREELIEAFDKRSIHAAGAVLYKMARHNFDQESRPAANPILDKFLRLTRIWIRDQTISEVQVGKTIDSYNQLVQPTKQQQMRFGDSWRYMAQWRGSEAAIARADEYYRRAQALGCQQHTPDMTLGAKMRKLKAMQPRH
ncbi:MAG: hypothetical protein ABIV43_00290 [Candidatus Saccharimonadales bacterium]